MNFIKNYWNTEIKNSVDTTPQVQSTLNTQEKLEEKDEDISEVELLKIEISKLKQEVKELKSKFEELRVLSTREKNYFIRTGTPFRFMPSFTLNSF